MRNHYDLIVIGAGVLGTFHAYHAAKAGKKVLLVERDQYPVNATVRNFGQAVTSGLSSEWFGHGRRAKAIYNSIQAEADISVRNNGTVYIASDDAEQQLIHELKVRMEAKDYQCMLLTSHQCVEKWPALRAEYCKEGLFFPQEISVEPDKMIYKLLQYCTSKFENLHYQPFATVIDCNISGKGVDITTNDAQKFHGEKVVLCNGHEFKLLFPAIFRESGIVVSKLQMMKTRPMPQVKLEGNILTGLSIRRYEAFEECPSFANTKHTPEMSALKEAGIHILFKKAVDGSIIVGDSHEYASVNNAEELGFGINQHINELMLTEAAKIVNFNVRDISATWAGFYSQHPEKNIVAIDLEDRVHIRTAIGGKGMTSSAGYAETSIRQIFNL